MSPTGDLLVTDGTYRFKKHVLPDVRDGQDIYDDAGASASNAILHPQEWDDDYSMGH